MAKKVMRICFFVFLASLVVWFGYSIYSSGQLMGGAVAVVKNQYFSYLPLIGWYEALFAVVIFGVKMETIIAGVLLLVTSISSSIIMVRIIDTSFYEEAIKTSVKIEKIKSAQKSGDTSLRIALQMKKRKIKKVKIGFEPEGARTIRQKQIIEERKKALFYLFDWKSLICVGVSIGLAYLINSDGDIENRTVILVSALIANAYAIFLFSMRSNKNELSRHYIYLIPDSIYKKLYAISYLQGVKFLLDATLSVVLVAMDQPVTFALLMTFLFLLVLVGGLYIWAATIFKRPEMNALFTKTDIIYTKNNILIYSRISIICL